ncbi:MAG: hypothetical protein WBI17_05810 [Clostridiaceae bacterium]
MNNLKYDSILEEGSTLLHTFTITYPYGLYKDSFYSSTYDELSKWLRGTIDVLKENSIEKFNDPFVQYLNSFRGKIGNIDKNEFIKILQKLEEKKKMN